MNTILQKRIEEAATFLFKQRGLDKESCRQAMYYILSNQWISVSEVLPSFGSLCLVDGKSGLKLSIYMNMFVDAGNITQRIGSVTHWMEIPSLEGGEE